MAFLIAAISLGFLGSFHCIGMCGPIALALPVHTMPLSVRVGSILAYNFGRVITYALLGALFGAIGQSLFLFGFQQLLSVILGVIILLGLFLSYGLTAKLKLFSGLNPVFSKFKNVIASKLRQKTISSFFTIGFLNGLLPCGLVYLAIAGAVATGNSIKGSVFMAVFGFGTLPFMFAISYTSHLITLRTRTVIRKMMPVMIGVMALLLVLRGLNLNIKYLSPAIAEQNVTSNTCHKQINCCHKK